MKYIFSIFILIFTITCSNSIASKNSPVLNDGEKWRIGYYQGGDFHDYQVILLKIFRYLEIYGWGKHEHSVSYHDSHLDTWKELISSFKSDYVELVEDAFYTSDFDLEKRKINRSNFLKRFKEKNDIDFVIAAGTWAGQDLATNDHDIPVMVISTSDPIKSKIIKSESDSGFDHVHAKVEPKRYLRQIETFYRFTNFTKLGLVLENSLEGRTYSGFYDVMDVSFEYGFEVITCFARNNNVSQEVANREVLKCYEKLAPKIDAMYITSHRGENLQNIPNLIIPLLKYKIPSFAMAGNEYVRSGVLMSMSHADFSYVSNFHANVMTRILNGEKPRNIKQLWHAPAKMALNMETARRINFDPPFEILVSADNVYQQIY